MSREKKRSVKLTALEITLNLVLRHDGRHSPAVPPALNHVALAGVALLARAVLVDEELGAAAKELDLELGAGVVPADEAHEVGVGDLVDQLLGLAQEVDKEVAQVVGDHGGEVELQPVEARRLGQLLVLAALPPGHVRLEPRPVELFYELRGLGLDLVCTQGQVDREKSDGPASSSAARPPPSG